MQMVAVFVLMKAGVRVSQPLLMLLKTVTVEFVKYCRAECVVCSRLFSIFVILLAFFGTQDHLGPWQAAAFWLHEVTYLITHSLCYHDVLSVTAKLGMSYRTVLCTAACMARKTEASHTQQGQAFFAK